jgi:hypothetical protein
MKHTLLEDPGGSLDNISRIHIFISRKRGMDGPAGSTFVVIERNKIFIVSLSAK